MKLKEILELKYGKSQKKITSKNGRYPIIGTGGILGYSNVFLYNKPSVIIGRKGSINNKMYIDFPFWVVDTTFYTIIDTKKVIPRWFYYYISTIDLNKYNEGTTIPSLTIKTLYELDIPYFPLEEQQHIVDIIGSIDDKIENNNKFIDKLYIFLDMNMKKLLNGKRYIMIRDCTDIEIISSGIDKFEKNKIYLDTSCVKNNTIIDISLNITYKNKPSRANMKPVINSVWFAKLKNSPKHIIVKSFSENILNNYIFSTGFMGIKSNEKKFNLISTYLISNIFDEEKNKLSIGATMQSINNDTFKNMYIPDFTENDFQYFNIISENVLKNIYFLEQENIKLNKLKQLYLAKFF